MRRRTFLQSTAGAALAACSSTSNDRPATPKDRPTNVVFVLTDDQAPHTLGAYGNPEIRTPHCDRLAAEGALMQNSFCTTPVCSPSRMTLLTGQVPSQHEVHDWINDENEGDAALRFLEERASEHPGIREVRGRGLMLGVECTEPGHAHAAALEALRRGVILLPSGADGSVLSVTPPLPIGREALIGALEILLASLP